jgi:polyhydroxybutyrate depolymerase
VDGVERVALVAVPTGQSEPGEKRPVVFAFHGHGGNMRQAARKFRFHQIWPGAIVVYMQGLPTPGALTDPEGFRNGWQKTAGDQKDRDLKFFDAVLASLKKDYSVDEKRIFATGHSNGGGFTFLLWAERGDSFAAMAPAAAAAARSLSKLKPKPALHLAGETDPLVLYSWQQRSIEETRKLNGCSETGKPWESSGSLKGTLYKSPTGAPFITLIHPGGHLFPDEASELIVKFFKQVADGTLKGKPEAKSTP